VLVDERPRQGLRIALLVIGMQPLRYDRRFRFRVGRTVCPVGASVLRGEALLRVNTHTQREREREPNSCN
jgi:hypothetical protein